MTKSHFLNSLVNFLDKVCDIRITSAFQEVSLKKKSSFFRDNFILIVIASTLGYGVWKHFSRTPAKAVSFKAESSEQVAEPKKTIEVIPPQRRTETVALQRQVLAARLAINARTFVPTVVGQNLQMTFRLEPRGRACKDGDIDLIRKMSGENGKLLLTLEDDSGTLVSQKKLATLDLKSPFVFPISLKPADQPRIFKLTLCSDIGRKTCNGLQAFDFEHNSKKLGQGEALKNRDNGHIFYSYGFGLIQSEVQLFDGTNLSSRASYAKFLKAVGGNERQLNVIEETVAQQKKLGILPLTVDKQTVVLPLYFNDQTQCTISMNGRRP